MIHDRCPDDRCTRYERERRERERVCVREKAIDAAGTKEREERVCV